MFKYKIIVISLITAFIGTTAYCQNNTDNHQKLTVSGSVISKDFVGSHISVQTQQGQIAFSVPSKAIIVRETHNVGLMDINQGDSVTVQYYIESPGQNVVTSIVGNSSTVNL